MDGDTLIVLDPVLGDDGARRMLELRRRFGRYRSTLGARAHYFREDYLYGGHERLPGIDLLVHLDSLTTAARRLHGRDVVEPAIVYANVLVPGQSLNVHTDLPEYRGADRRTVPQWLLLVMQHSELFERWRLPIATGITYFGGGRGGAFVYYPDGPGGEPATFTPRHDTGIVLDTDTVFHGVQPVEGDSSALRSFRPGVYLEPDGDGSGDRWAVRSANGTRVLGTYDGDELRYSVSWKAYCFADAAERSVWADHSDDLDHERIVDVLVADLRARGDGRAGTAGRPPDPDLRPVLEGVYGGTSWLETELARTAGTSGT